VCGIIKEFSGLRKDSNNLLLGDKIENKNRGRKKRK
jgi:hypothetical protein